MDPNADRNSALAVPVTTVARCRFCTWRAEHQGTGMGAFELVEFFRAKLVEHARAAHADLDLDRPRRDYLVAATITLPAGGIVPVIFPQPVYQFVAPPVGREA